MRKVYTALCVMSIILMSGVSGCMGSNEKDNETKISNSIEANDKNAKTLQEPGGEDKSRTEGETQYEKSWNEWQAEKADAFAGERELVLDYLRNKYDEEFEYGYVAGASWGQSFDEWRMKPIGADEDKFFYVIAKTEKDGTYVMSDNYYGILIEDEYKEFMTELVKDEFEEFEIFAIGANQKIIADGLVKGVGVLDIPKYANGALNTYNPTVYIAVKDSSDYDYDKSLKSLLEKMAGFGLMCSIEIFAVEANQYDELELDVALRSNKHGELVKNVYGIIDNKLEITILK